LNAAQQNLAVSPLAPLSALPLEQQLEALDIVTVI
jgi:hypothetical protein